MKYVIGIGNYSMFDDSIGIRLIEHIEEKSLAQGFTAIDLSGNGINLMSYLTDETEKILIVDTARIPGNPGEFHFFKPERVKSVKKLANISSHEGDIVKIIELAREADYPMPYIEFMGIVPEEIKLEFGLSKTLENKIDEYLEAILTRIKE